MARYLRDEQIENVKIDEELLTQLDNEFFAVSETAPEYTVVKGSHDHGVYLIHTIRFDQKGYRVFTQKELLSYFNQASDIERIVLQVQTKESLNSNNMAGSYVSLTLDKNQSSFLTVSSEDETWVNSAFSTVRDILVSKKNKNGLIRNPWVELLIQLFGVIGGFALSLWGASKIAPALKIENAFLISFLLVLLIFSNLWAQLSMRLKELLHYSFPSVSFYRVEKDRLHWLMQALVGGVVVAISLYLLGGVFGFVGRILGGFIGAGI